MKSTSKVRIIAFNSDPKNKTSQIAPVYLAPAYDELTRTFKVGDNTYKGKISDGKMDGLDVIVAEGSPVPMTNHDSYRFIHLQEFDQNKEIDKFLLDVLMSSGMCAKNKGSVNPTEHRYYLENKEADAEETISKYEKSLQALKKIDDLKSDDKRMDFARIVLKTNVNAYSSKQVHAELIKLAYENPDFIITAGSDPLKEYRMFLKKLVDAKILLIKGGRFYNGEHLIGTNEDLAVEYMKDTNNSVLVEQWSKELKAKRKAATEVEGQ